ncbi:MAG: putative toxin-antitoxin system toxin component, PIN family [Candidatus Sabulitectum sp.]|nr:putative toxin-antitoxin system toxin component, PIN family [Candidatus Sabulitectum sp.]
MIITLDTNIMYQALRSSGGASFYILQLVRRGRFQIAISNPTFHEYEDVLMRPQSLKKFDLDREDVIKFLRYIAFIGEKFDPRFLFRPNLKDEDDNMFVELAVTSNSKYLVTSNTKDFQHTDLIFKDFQLITPAEFVKEWRRNNG